MDSRTSHSHASTVTTHNVFHMPAYTHYRTYARRHVSIAAATALNQTAWHAHARIGLVTSSVVIVVDGRREPRRLASEVILGLPVWRVRPINHL